MCRAGAIAGRPDIPEAILTKAPSAELRPGQTDQDSLPPYELLDQILELHVEQSKSAEEIVARGFDEATVRRVVKLVRNAEFKRKQAAPGVESDVAGIRHRLAHADRTGRVAAVFGTRCPQIAKMGRKAKELPASSRLRVSGNPVIRPARLRASGNQGCPGLRDFASRGTSGCRVRCWCAHG